MKFWMRSLSAISLGVLALLGAPQLALVSPAMAAPLTLAQAEAQILTAINTKNTATLTATINSILSANPSLSASTLTAYAVTNDPTLAASIIATAAKAANTNKQDPVAVTSAGIAALDALITATGTPAGHVTLAAAEALITQTISQLKTAMTLTTAQTTELNTTLTNTVSSLVTANLSQASSIAGYFAANNASLAPALINAAVLADKSNAVAVATAGIAALQALPSGLTAAQAAGLIAQTVAAVGASVPADSTQFNTALTNSINTLATNNPSLAGSIVSAAAANDQSLAVTITNAAIAALQAQITSNHLTMVQGVADIAQTIAQVETAVPSTTTQLNTALNNTITTLVSSYPSLAASIVSTAATNNKTLAASITSAAIAALQAQVKANQLTLAQAEAYIIQTVVQTGAAVPSIAASLNTTLTSTIGTLVTANLSQANAIVATAVANDPSLAAALINAAVLADKSNAVAVATAGITALQALPGGLTVTQAAGLIAQTVVAVEASVPSTATQLNATLTSTINTLMSNNPSLAGAIVGSVAASDPAYAATIANAAIASLQAQITSGKLTAVQGVTDIALTIAQVEAAVPSTTTALNTTLTNLITALVTANPSLAAMIANDAAVNDPSFTVNAAAAAVAALQAMITPNGGTGHLTLLQAEELVTQTIVQVVSTDPSHQSQLNTLEINFINTEVLANPTLASSIVTTAIDGIPIGTGNYPSLAPTIINTAAQAALSKGQDPVAVTLAGIAAIEALITYSGPVPAGHLSLAQAQAIITQSLIQVEGSLKLSGTQIAALKNTNVDNDHIINNQFVSPH